MNEMNGEISDAEVKKANKELHDIEAQYYDILHGGIWNFYEQWQTKQDIGKIAKLLGRKPLEGERLAIERKVSKGSNSEK